MLLPSKFFQVLSNGSPSSNQMLKTYKKLKWNVNKCFVKLNKIKIKKRNFKALPSKFIQEATGELKNFKKNMNKH
jgi:hypothetical protein